MQIADREFGARDMDGEVDLRASREVLDVAITSMLRAALVEKAS